MISNRIVRNRQTGAGREIWPNLPNRGIEAKVHYPKAIHMQPAAAYLGYKPGDFPKAEADCACIITLPAHQHLTRDELDYTAQSVHDFYRGK